MLKNICLNESTLERIRGRRNKSLKVELAAALDLSVSSIDRLLRENSSNGFLTTLAAVEIIGNTLNLTNEQIIEIKNPE